jgi:hypothetical protein
MNGLPHVSVRLQRLYLKMQSNFTPVGKGVEFVNPNGGPGCFCGTVVRVLRPTLEKPIKTFSVWWDDVRGYKHTSGEVYEVKPCKVTARQFCFDEEDTLLVSTSEMVLGY